MKITITFDVDTEDKRYSEILEVLKKFKTDNTIKEGTVDTSMLLSNAGRIESLFTEATNALMFWKLDDDRPDVNHWDISGNAVLVRDKNGWCVVLQYRPSSGFRAFITDDNTYTPLFNLEETGKTIRIAMDSLYKKFTKLKNTRQEVKS